MVWVVRVVRVVRVARVVRVVRVFGFSVVRLYVLGVQPSVLF